MEDSISMKEKLHAKGQYLDLKDLGEGSQSENITAVISAQQQVPESMAQPLNGY